MRNECNIIRDILPLYADKMVSADTASFVEEHLIGCAECRAELEKLKAAELYIEVLRFSFFSLLNVMLKNGEIKLITLLCSMRQYGMAN